MSIKEQLHLFDDLIKALQEGVEQLTSKRKEIDVILRALEKNQSALADNKWDSF